MSEKLLVYLKQVRYNGAVPMRSADVQAFIGQMEEFAANYTGGDVKVSCPPQSESLLFEFDLGEEG